MEGKAKRVRRKKKMRTKKSKKKKIIQMSRNLLSRHAIIFVGPTGMSLRNDFM